MEPDKKKSVVAVIPARWHSSRFPGKPLVEILGKPMIQHVYERACLSQFVADVWVATDDQKIFETVQNFGGKALFTSPSHQSGTERVAEVAQKISADIFINVQGDEPLIQPQAIDSLAKAMIKEPSIPMGTLKKRITRKQDVENPNCVKVVTDYNGFALYFSRSPIPYNREKNASLTYYKHIGIYAYRKEFLQKIPRLPASTLEKAEKLEQLRILENGFSIKVIETEYESYGVDTPQDLTRISQLIDKTIT